MNGGSQTRFDTEAKGNRTFCISPCIFSRSMLLDLIVVREANRVPRVSHLTVPWSEKRGPGNEVDARPVTLSCARLRTK